MVAGINRKKNARAERAIYGLKHGGRMWGRLRAQPPIEEGFEQQCKADPCITRTIVDGVVVMVVGVYVDDFLTGGSVESCDVPQQDAPHKQSRGVHLGTMGVASRETWSSVHSKYRRRRAWRV